MYRLQTLAFVELEFARSISSEQQLRCKRFLPRSLSHSSAREPFEMGNFSSSNKLECFLVNPFDDSRIDAEPFSGKWYCTLCACTFQKSKELFTLVLFTYVIEIDIKTGNLIWPNISQRRGQRWRRIRIIIEWHAVLFQYFIAILTMCVCVCQYNWEWGRERDRETVKRAVECQIPMCNAIFNSVWFGFVSLVLLMLMLLSRIMTLKYLPDKKKPGIFCCIRNNFNELFIWWKIHTHTHDTNASTHVCTQAQNRNWQMVKMHFKFLWSPFSILVIGIICPFFSSFSIVVWLFSHHFIGKKKLYDGHSHCMWFDFRPIWL